MVIGRVGTDWVGTDSGWNCARLGIPKKNLKINKFLLIRLEMIGLDIIRLEMIELDRVRNDRVRNYRVRNDRVRNDRGLEMIGLEMIVNHIRVLMKSATFEFSAQKNFTRGKYHLV